MSSSEPSAPKPPSVAESVKRLRRQGGLSLDDLARRCGVSRSMLSQIERGAANPTVATLWRITQVLGTSIDAVLGQEKGQVHVELIPPHVLPRMSSADGLMALRVLGPLESAGTHEWYELLAQPGGRLSSQAHSAGTVEHLYVVEGSMQITSHKQVQVAQAGELARYRADVPHELHNPGPNPSTAWLTVMLHK